MTRFGRNLPDDEIPVGASYSGGTSSEHMVQAVIVGEIPRPKHFAVFFADTKDEHAWTYERAEMVEEDCKRAGIPFFRCGHRTPLWDDVMAATRGDLTRVDTPPLWTENQGGGRGRLTQQCNSVYKIAAVRRSQSAWLESLGLPKRIKTWIGFAKDEVDRALKAVANSDVQWATLDFPAIRYGIDRVRQRAELTKWKGSAPPWSACIRCPWNDDDRWRDTPKNEIERAIETDYAIRDGLEKVGVVNTCYLSDSLIPLEQLLKKGRPQMSLPGFEKPGCSSGACFL